MDVVSLSPALSPKEIQRIRTRLTPFQTIHFMSAASEEARFRIAPKVRLLPQVVYKPTLVVVAFKQMAVFEPLKKRICTLFENFMIEWTLNLTLPHCILLELIYVFVGRTWHRRASNRNLVRFSHKKFTQKKLCV
jgi:hypothetical protein